MLGINDTNNYIYWPPQQVLVLGAIRKLFRSHRWHFKYLIICIYKDHEHHFLELTQTAVYIYVTWQVWMAACLNILYLPEKFPLKFLMSAYFHIMSFVSVKPWSCRQMTTITLECSILHMSQGLFLYFYKHVIFV